MPIRSRKSITSGNWKLIPNISGNITAKLIHSGVDPVVACRASVAQALTDDVQAPASKG